MSIPDADLASVLMNLLNNALEAYAELQPQEKRWIAVTIKHHAPYLYISIKNAIHPTSAPDSTTFETTKKDPILHGFGLPTIRKTAEKHGGFAKFEKKENRFAAEAVLNTEAADG